MKYQLKALSIRDSINDYYGQMICYWDLGKLYAQKERYDISESYLFKAKRLADTLQQRNELKNTYAELAKLYSKSGRYKKAVDYLDKFITLKDSIVNEDTNRKIRNLEIAHKVSEKQDSIQFLRINHEIVSQNLEKQETISKLLIGLTALVLVSLLLLWHSYNIKKQRNQLLKSNNETLEKLNEGLTSELELKENELLSPELLGKKKITLTSNGKELIQLDTIIYIKAEGNGVRIFTTQGVFWDWQFLKTYKKLLPNALFIQVHRSYIVNYRHIKARKARLLIMSNEDEIGIGGTLRNEVNAILDQKQKI